MNDVASIQLKPRVETLPNGLMVILEYLPYVHSASVGIWIKTGSANESAERSGISHFLEHLLFKGTETRTTREIMDAIEGAGGQMNAFTSREYTCYYVRMLERKVAIGIEILADMVKHSTFHDLDKERNVILEEIASSFDVPDEYVHDVLTAKVWPEHSLGRPIAGSEETVSATGHDEVRAYMADWYKPENMCISIAGKFDVDATLKQIEDEFGSIETGHAPDDSGAPEFSAGVQFEEREIGQNHLALAFPGVKLSDPRRYTFDLLSNTLGGGSTSRLFESIREDAGLAYAVYTFNSMYAHAGMLGVYAAIAPENLALTLDLASAELKRLQDEIVGDEELSNNREQLKGGLLLALEGTFNRMVRMARSYLCFGRVIPVEEILEHVDAVSSADIQALAQEVFSEDRCAKAIVGPNKGQDTVLHV